MSFSRTWDGLAVAEEPPFGAMVLEWAIYVAEAPSDASVILDAEHDASRWLASHCALSLCRPSAVTDRLRIALEAIERARYARSRAGSKRSSSGSRLPRIARATSRPQAKPRTFPCPE